MSECRICFNSEKGALVTPCRCNGTIKHIHQSCLTRWLKEKYPFEYTMLLRQKNQTKNTGLHCELCNYEFKANAKYLKPLQIFKKIGYSNVTYGVLLNIPIIVFLAYKFNSLLRHLFLFIYDQTIHSHKSDLISRKIVGALKLYIGIVAKLFPISIVAAVLPMIIYRTLALTCKLFTEFKVLQIENLM